jgi:chromosome partitioning protein
VAVANQKGGVAKTTTVHSLGVALAQSDRRVLLADLDPQGSLTWACGIDPDAVERSMHEVLLRRSKAGDAVQPVNGLSLLPSTIDLAGAEMHLLTKTGREYVLRKALSKVVDDYDVVLIDCPPSLGILTINGLTAADEVLIPLQCEALGQRGVGQLMETIDDVRTYTNRDLAVRGVIATMFDGRTKLARQVVEEVREAHGLEVFDPPVPKSVKAAEAPGHGVSVLEHAPRSRPAEAYRALAEAIFPAGRGRRRKGR